jgi:hypothetical protein
MSKTRLLRGLIREQLQTVQGETYHKVADKDAAYPYKTYLLESINFADSTRDDFDLVIDIWDRSPDQKTVEEIADQIEALFNASNIPKPPIYPTFFRDGRNNIDDPDKNLQHIQLHFIVQLYEEV